MNFSDMYTKFS